MKRNLSKLPTEKILKKRVVAMGGGTGLPVVLRSLKKKLFPDPAYRFNSRDRKRLTAIVTVTDDGGSSGQLRRDFSIIPPGDIRNCLTALAGNNALSSELFQYRFERGEGLEGHSLGNLLLTALTDLKGDFMEALGYFSKILDIRGQIIPLTSMNINLVARFMDGHVIKGESSIVRQKGKIKYVFLSPVYPEPVPSAIEAIEKADAIVIGPGSLYTSIIPNLLISEIREAIKVSKAKKIYICNLMTEPGETDYYTATDHIRAILDHTEYGLFQYVILNKGRIHPDLERNYAGQGYHQITITHDLDEIRTLGLTSVVADIVSAERDKVRHDEEKLGRLLSELI
jgi:uncharacterized cofD-like protein